MATNLYQIGTNYTINFDNVTFFKKYSSELQIHFTGGGEKIVLFNKKDIKDVEDCIHNEFNTYPKGEMK